jgi:ATP-dependent DNA helicase RecQ
VLLAAGRDKGLHVFFINQTDGEEAKRRRWAQYRAIWGYVDGESCRRAAILRHFGDGADPSASGRCCDVCDGPLREVKAPPKPARATGDADIRDAIISVVEAASPSVGRTRAVEILRGGRSKVVLKYGYDELSGYGEYSEWRAEEVLAEVDALIDSGGLRSTGGRYPKLGVGRRAA